ncbi:hypothetical protein O0L34_g781 [Tuta absoluta]|nr:hypothetical protein O0L34_g3397 [Tuta absoluta]KAJ2953204.1 hypothetical protein O0L34_g781 [Tuta absoluta]
MQNKLKALIAIAIFISILWMYRVSVSTTEKAESVIFKKYESHNDYLLQPATSVCAQRSRLVIIVTSYVGHVELRSAHRRAMPAELLQTLNASRVFLLAKIPSRETSIVQEAIKNENEIFGDLLQGAFDEHYRNLTLKHLMGLRWASTRCANAAYILKIDDDTVFRLDKTYNLLSQIKDLDKSQLLLGYMLNNTIPKRQKHNKWYVSWEEFGRSVYPSYLSGWYYITTPQVAAALVEEALYHPPFWIDDVFITGILAEATGIKLRNLPKGFWMEYYEQVECCIKDMIEKNIKCDRAVGPNGNRNNLIVEFNTALSDCDERKECASNTAIAPLCVVGKERTIFSDGRGDIQAVKF